MSGLLAIKLVRDLRATWSRIALMVIAIAVSLTVFGAMLSAWSVVSRETGNAYAGTEPASATILLDQPIDVGRMATIVAEAQTRPGVVAATGRTQFIGDVEVGGRLLDIPLQVFVAAPNDPLRMARFEVHGASWPPSPGEVFIARDSLVLLGVAVGDRLTVALPNGERAALLVAGTVYDPSLSPSPQEQMGRGYLSTTSLVASDRDVALDQLKLQVAEPAEATPSRNRETIIAVAGDVGEWLRREHGLAIREIQVPTPYAHPHQWQADSLVSALLAGGATAVLLSTILVASMLNGLFTQQIPHIGIMKAIGARSGAIARLYLALTLVVAAMATLLALVPAILGGQAFAGQVIGFLGIEASSLDPEWWAYAVIVAIGLGMPPLMALVPVLNASRTTVRAAIDHHGGSAKSSAATGVLAGLGRLRRLDRGLLMALRNTVRRPARFLLTVGLLASAGAVFVAGMSVSAGVAAVEEEQTAQRTWDVDVQLASPRTIDEVVAMLEVVPAITRVEGVNVVPTGLAGPGQIPVTRTYPDQGHGRVSLTAIPAGSTMLTPPRVLEGRWLKPGETGAVVLNQVARNNGGGDRRIGDPIQLLIGGRATPWRVAGIVEEPGGGSAVYTTAEGLAEATGQPQRVNLLRIATDGHDEATRTQVAETVDDVLTSAGVEVLSAASVSRREAITEGHLGPLITIVLAIAVAIGVIGGIGLASTMSANVLERTREFGVMRAIGARPRVIRRIVTAEGVFLALASCLVAVIPTLALTAVLGTGLGNLFLSAALPFRISGLAVGIWVTLVILGAILATEAAATRASRTTVREALTYL